MPVKPALTAVMAPAALLLLGGCVSTAAKIVTAPVRVVSKAADWATTSQSESDEKRGRALRQREERYGKLERDYRRQAERCDDGNDDACDRARDAREEMQDLRASIPAERDRRERDRRERD